MVKIAAKQRKSGSTGRRQKNKASAKASAARAASKVALVASDQIEGRDRFAHPNLPAEMLQRIEHLHTRLRDVCPRTLPEWIDDFRHDFFPEEEIAVWEVMAEAFERFTEDSNLRQEQLAEIFPAILLSGHDGCDYVTATVRCRTVSRRRIKEIAAYMASKVDSRCSA